MDYEEDDGLPNLQDAYTLEWTDLQFIDEIGRGSFGVVYKGLFFGTEVAIKCMKKSLIEQHGLEKFIRRELFVSRFSHPSIVQFIGVCERPDTAELLLVTEYVPGGDVKTILKDKKIEIPWLLRARMAYDVACAMSYLHAKKILHRDLKSKNLLLSFNWRVKLCDFGLARQLTSNQPRPMTICGTETYMSPEVIMGDPYNEKCDIFSFGVVLFELITRSKVKKSMPRSVADGYKINEEELRKLCPQGAPRSFVQLTMDCLNNDPTTRPSFPQVLKKIEIIFREIEQGILVPEGNSNSVPPSSPHHPPPSSSPSNHPTHQNVSSSQQTTALNSNSSHGPSSSPVRAVEAVKQVSPPSSTILLPVKKVGSFNISNRVKLVDFDKLKTLKFDNPEKLLEEVSKFFSATSFSGWIVVGYKDANVLCFQKSGSESVDELVASLSPTEVQYALIRVPIIDKGDPYNQKTRDIFIQWVGPQVPTTQRGRKASHVGQVQGLLKPYHAELTAISKQNFTLQNLLAKSEPLSGSHVLD